MCRRILISNNVFAAMFWPQGSVDCRRLGAGFLELGAPIKESLQRWTDELLAVVPAGRRINAFFESPRGKAMWGVPGHVRNNLDTNSLLRLLALVSRIHVRRRPLSWKLIVACCMQISVKQGRNYHGPLWWWFDRALLDPVVNCVCRWLCHRRGYPAALIDPWPPGHVTPIVAHPLSALHVV